MKSLADQSIANTAAAKLRSWSSATPGVESGTEPLSPLRIRCSGSWADVSSSKILSVRSDVMSISTDRRLDHAAQLQAYFA